MSIFRPQPQGFTRVSATPYANLVLAGRGGIPRRKKSPPPPGNHCSPPSPTDHGALLLVPDKGARRRRRHPAVLCAARGRWDRGKKGRPDPPPHPGQGRAGEEERKGWPEEGGGGGKGLASSPSSCKRKSRRRRRPGRAPHKGGAGCWRLLRPGPASHGSILQELARQRGRQAAPPGKPAGGGGQWGGGRAGREQEAAMPCARRKQLLERSGFLSLRRVRVSLALQCQR